VAYYTGATTVDGLAFAGAGLVLKTNSANNGLEWGTAGSGSGTVASGDQYQLAYYPAAGTTVDGLDASGTAGYFLKSGGTAGAPEWQAVTGTGNVVLANSPSLVTPTLGVASATSINKVAITAPATSATLTIVDGSTLATSGAFSTTLTATANTNVTLPTAGTLATLAGTETFTNKTLNGPKIGSTGGQGHFHIHSTNSVPTGLTDYITVFGDVSPTKKMGFLFETDGFESYFQFNATSTDKTYTFPDDTGTVALINGSNYLSVPKSGGVSGGIILEGGTSGTVSLEAPLVAGAQSYILPSAYPAASSGYYLTSTDTGTLAWNLITGGGDVTGPSSLTTNGNFAVFSSTGKIIAESGIATLSNVTGRATFNNGVDLGVSSSATGTLVFRNSANAFTTTIQASTSASASAIYSWPQTPAASAGLILANDGSGNLSWTAAGAGNMILASTQTNTGAKTFNSGTLILAGSTSGTTILNAAATAGSTTVTLPALTGTVALLENAQTFTGAKTFGTGAFAVTSTATFSASASAAASVTINPAANWSLTNPQLLISSNASGIQWMSFGAGDRNPPAFTTRSVGTKIVLYATVTAGNADHAIGVASSVTWISAPTATGHRTSIYGGTSELASFRNSGIYVEMPGSSTQGQVTIGTNTASTYSYIDFGGGTNVRGVPAATRSVGTRINMLAGSSGTDDHSIGVAANETWIKTNNATGGTISFYGGITKLVDITATAGGAPVINLNAATGEYRVNGTKVVAARITGYGTPTNGNRTLSFAAVSSAEQVLAQLVADLRTHGLIG
jgi:hypothetical protein